MKSGDTVYRTLYHYYGKPCSRATWPNMRGTPWAIYPTIVDLIQAKITNHIWATSSRTLWQGTVVSHSPGRIRIEWAKRIGSWPANYKNLLTSFKTLIRY